MPAAVGAYSFNITAAPPGPLSFLSAWPSGQAYRGASTLNSPRGRTVANAAIIPAGVSGAVMFAAGQTTDLIVDVNAYFVDSGSPNALYFYPTAPCRAMDTRA